MTRASCGRARRRFQMPDVEAICDIRNRAWDATWQGRYIDALHIYEEELAPLNEPRLFGNLTNLAILHLLMGHLDNALAAFQEARALPPPPAIPVPFIGAILWMQGKHKEACEDWAYEIGRRRLGIITHSDEAGGVEVPALLWWASAHTGFEGWRKLAEQELRKRGRTKRCQNSRWPGPLVSYLVGQSSEHRSSDELLINRAAAYSACYPNINFRYKCLAYFYVGTAYLARGNAGDYEVNMVRISAAKSPDIPAGAPPMLDGVDALRLCNPEYHLARAELQTARTNRD